MASAKAAGASLLFVGGGGSAGYGIKEMLKMEPDATLLSSLGSNLTNTYASDKYGNTGEHKNYFVDPDKNQSWWEYIYKSRYDKSGTKSEEFKGVTLGFSSSSSSALNRICKVAFQKEKKKLVKIGYKKDIWRYCSKGGLLPVDLEKRPNSTSYTSTNTTQYGGLSENKDKFVAEDAGNEEWWNWVYVNVFERDKSDSDQQEKLHDNFKNANKGYDASGSNALNQICKTAYEKKASELVDTKYKENIWKYCSKDGTVPSEIGDMPKSFALDSEGVGDKHTVSGDEGIVLGKVNDNKSKLIANVAENEEWWNWMYLHKLKVDIDNTEKNSNIYTTFKSVDKGYSSTDTKALNLVCKEGYEKKKADLEKGDNYKSSIEDYCTRDGGVLELPKDPVPETKEKTCQGSTHTGTDTDQKDTGVASGTQSQSTQEGGDTATVTTAPTEANACTEGQPQLTSPGVSGGQDSGSPATGEQGSKGTDGSANSQTQSDQLTTSPQTNPTEGTKPDGTSDGKSGNSTDTSDSVQLTTSGAKT